MTLLPSGSRSIGPVAVGATGPWKSCDGGGAMVVARCERLIRLVGGRVASDIELAGGEPAASILRRISQLG